MEYVEFSAKTVSDAITEALIRFGTTSDKIEYEVIEKGSTGFLGFKSKPAIIRARKKFTVEEAIQDFLSDVFHAMNMQVDVFVQYNQENNSADVELRGSQMGLLIGKRGQTLDALQYLVNLAVNKLSDTYVKIKLDTENYRKRRRETLENLASNIAYKVKRTKRPVALEPMNPFERRVIHSALQNDRYVVTYSEGDEPYRHVVVALKREKQQ